MLLLTRPFSRSLRTPPADSLSEPELGDLVREKLPAPTYWKREQVLR